MSACRCWLLLFVVCCLLCDVRCLLCVVCSICSLIVAGCVFFAVCYYLRVLLFAVRC